MLSKSPNYKKNHWNHYTIVTSLKKKSTFTKALPYAHYMHYLISIFLKVEKSTVIDVKKGKQVKDSNN